MTNNILLAFLISSNLVTQVPIQPNSNLTPGVVDDTATIKKICSPNYSETVRHVSKLKKKHVFELYNINPTTDKFEIDHLISLELGGSNDIRNLWPESYTSKPWNAYHKDKLENKLHKMVCDNIMDLEDAQNEISTDWVGAYKKYIGDK